MVVLRWYHFVWIVVFTVALPRWVNAFSFDLSPAEFAAWPLFCQARYSSIPGVSFRHDFSRNFPPGEVERQRRILGAETFEHLHHWCAGTTWLNRSRFEVDSKMKAFQLTSANEEAVYTLVRLPPDSPIISAVHVTLGSICQEQEDFNCARENFEKAISISPTDPSPYSALALLQRKMMDLSLARDTLVRGNKAVDDKSPEIHYNLGLISLELKEVDNALMYAQKAYRAGYPLLGLKNKLKKLGRWAEPGKESAPKQAGTTP